MSGKKSCIEPYEAGAPMDGPAAGRVLSSNAEGFAVGDHVVHGLGWRDCAVLDAVGAQNVDPNLAPLSSCLGVLGVPGLTAYIGLTRFAEVKEGTPCSCSPRPPRPAAWPGRSPSSRVPAG